MSSVRTSSSPPKTKIFVGRLPEEARPDDLKRLFEEHGTVTECDILNRYGFVHMKTPEMATRAIDALHNSNFMGAQISVEASTGKKSGRSSGSSSSGRGGFGGPMRGRGGRGMGRPPYMRDGYDRRPGPPPHGPPPAMRNGYGGGYDNYNRGGYDDYYPNRGGPPPPPSMQGRDRSMPSARDDRRPSGGYNDMRGGGPGYDRRPYPERGGGRYEPRPPPPSGPPFERRDYPPRMPNDGYRRRSPPPALSGYGGSGFRKEPPSDYGPSRRSHETSESMADRTVDSILKISGSPVPSRSPEKAPSIKEHTSDLPSSIEDQHFTTEKNWTLCGFENSSKNGKREIKRKCCDSPSPEKDKTTLKKPDPNTDLSIKKNPKKLKDPNETVITIRKLPDSLRKKSFLRKREIVSEHDSNSKEKFTEQKNLERGTISNSILNKQSPFVFNEKTFPNKKTFINNNEFAFNNNKTCEIQTELGNMKKSVSNVNIKKRPLTKTEMFSSSEVDKNKNSLKDKSSVTSPPISTPEIELQINTKMDPNKYNLILKWLDKNFGKTDSESHNDVIQSWNR